MKIFQKIHKEWILHRKLHFEVYFTELEEYVKIYVKICRTPKNSFILS